MISIKKRSDDTNFGEISREVVKRIYYSLKKRKLYQKFKLCYRPLDIIKRDTERAIHFEDWRKIIYIPVGNKEKDCILYKPNRKKRDVYDGSKFFKGLTIALIMLRGATLTHPKCSNENVAPSIITQYLAQDYFENYIREHKVPKRESFYSFIFGTLFTILGITTLSLLSSMLVGKAAIGITLVLIFGLCVSLAAISICS